MYYYLLQIIALQLVFLVFYKLFLNKETFFQWNRFYLLFSVLASLIIPKLQLDWTSTKSGIYITLEPVIIGSRQLEKAVNVQQGNNYWNIIYFIGAGLSLLFFIYKIIKLFISLRNRQIVNTGNAKIVLIPELQNAYTFLNYIFIDKQLYNSSDLHIIEHELVHIKQKHWIDLLIMELLKIGLWFNPLIYIYQNNLKTVHEYIADKSVLKNVNFANYYNKVLQLTFKTQKISFANEFYKSSLIKKRIKMQKKKKSGNWAKVKYAGFILLLMSITLFVDACQTKEQENNKEAEKNTPTVTKQKVAESDTQDLEVAYQYIEKAPMYQGCTEIDQKKINDYNSKSISKFVGDNFNKDIADKLSIEGKIKIMTQFTIQKDGSIGNVKARSKYKELADEAKRVIKLLPKFTPGEQKGKPAKVTYTLPIIFNITE